MRLVSVQEGDLHMRVTNMLESYWGLRSHLPKADIADLGVSFHTQRLGASLTFDCLRRWKRDVEQARDRDASCTPLPTSHQGGGGGQGGAQQMVVGGRSGSVGATGNAQGVDVARKLYSLNHLLAEKRSYSAC